ncbi:MAG: DeoR/GlpR transcriptional regulator [Ruminococcaceae bacterium]|nr:DeoR/GlpR transcriptional regulator [Oscillospiraceae bacterium]
MNTIRREQVKEMLHSKPFLSLKELMEKFPNVSSMTLRRDIDYFESQGEAIKVRGGARSMKFITTSMEESFNLRLYENMSGKEKIARKAIEMIETGRSIFLDSGTTMLKLATMLPDERLSITTTGPNIALELIKKSLPIINLVGGMLNRDNISVSGTQALNLLDDINIDTAFLVPSGMSAEDGLTSGNYSECELKQFILNKARRVVILMDSSKLGKSLPYTFGDFSKVSAIITDRVLPPDIDAAARAGGAEIIIA